MRKKKQFRKKKDHKKKKKSKSLFPSRVFEETMHSENAWESVFFFFFAIAIVVSSLHDPLPCVPMVVELEIVLAMLARAQRTMRLNDTVDIISEDLVSNPDLSADLSSGLQLVVLDILI